MSNMKCGEADKCKDKTCQVHSIPHERSKLCEVPCCHRNGIVGATCIETGIQIQESTHPIIVKLPHCEPVDDYWNGYCKAQEDIKAANPGISFVEGI